MTFETKTMKFIFFTVIVCLIAVAIYVISQDNKKIAVNVDKNAKKEVLANSISIGIIDIDTLNPLLTKNRDCEYLLKLVYNPLIDIKNNFELKPSLATEWTKLEPKEYLIKLNKDKQWHDGTPFMAQDVEFTIEFLKSDLVNSIYKGNVQNIDSVSIIDEYTIKIYLKEETEFFEYKLIFPIIAKHQFDEDFKFIAETPVGTGFYQFKDIQEDKIKLYNENARTKELEIYINDNIMSLYSDFAKENIDALITSNLDYESFLGTIGYKTQLVQDREFNYIQINQNNEILKDGNIRKALNYAINRKELIYAVYKNKYQEANFPLNSINKWKDEFDINKCQELLLQQGWSRKEEGWQKDDKSLYFTLAVNGELEDRVRVAELIKEQFEAIGIKIEIINLDTLNYQIALENNYYDLILTGNIIPIEPNYKNYFIYPSTEVEKLLQEISEIDNSKIRKIKIQELLKYYNKEMPFISLYFNTNALLLNANLKGDFEGNWFNLFYNIETWVKEK